MADTTEIQVGDVVHLRSGGPAMTVVKLAGDCESATAGWFMHGSQYETASFALASLEKRTASPPDA